MAKWIDSAEDYTFDGKSAINNTSAKQSQRFNAMWYDDSATASGSHYFEVTAKEGSNLWIGITDKKHFASGWKLAGMMYGGNTSNGKGLVTKAFGPSINKGDTAGCLYEFSSAKADGDRLVVTFYHNGSCWGPAFDIVKKNWDPLHPVVSSNNGGESFTINDRAAVPSQRTRAPPKDNEGMIGSWECLELSCVLDLSGNEERMKGVAHIVNSISFPLEKSGGKWAAGIAASTMMAGPPEMTEKEKKFEKILPKLESISLDEHGMVWKHGDGSLKFKPYATPPPKPSSVNMLGA